jgi:hypothetical protein
MLKRMSGNNVCEGAVVAKAMVESAPVAKQPQRLDLLRIRE